jgi:hypothetical protein
MGSLFGSKTPAPPPPAPPATVRDEIGGVEQVPVTQPDGSVTYVTRRLPLTPEERARKAELDSILQEALGEIQKLSATDYVDDEATRKVLDQWQATRVQLQNQSATSRAQQEEDILARRGLSDSSTAQDVRRTRMLDDQRAQQTLQQQRDELGLQVRNERLGLQQNLYNLAAGERDLAEVRTSRAALQGQSSVAAINAQRQASLLDYYQASNRQSDPFSNALGQGLGASLGRTAGTAIGGPWGGAAGSFLGSWLWRR